MTEDETVGWDHQLSGHKFEQTPGNSEGQRSLACCSPWGHRVGQDLATEQEQQSTYTITNISVKGKFLVDGNAKWF